MFNKESIDNWESLSLYIYQKSQKLEDKFRKNNKYKESVSFSEYLNYFLNLSLFMFIIFIKFVIFYINCKNLFQLALLSCEDLDQTK